MLISYKWLESYFKEKLPEPEKLAGLITFGFAEVEGIEKKGEDTILDIKVLPDRACYALSHRGVAYEISAITGLPKNVFSWPQPKVAKVRPLKVTVEAPELCPRYMARVIENITQKDAPWVKEHLEAVGQRSINPIVDGANIVMFDMGQPLHAFDADKVEGDILVRLAKKGEKITTLDNREVILDEKVLIIADEKSPLAIAGIKGGTKAAVTAETKNLILEAANFNASNIRKTSERLGIRTDASKRFENRLSPETAANGMNDFSALLFEMDKNLAAGEVLDCYPKKFQVIKLKVERGAIDAKLGIELSEKEIEEIFSRLEFKFEKGKYGWLVTPPAFRMDLSIPEDIAEEVGRLYGYEKIPAVLPPKSSGKTEIPKSFYYEWKIREILAGAGFSEVMTSSFSAEGQTAILKPLAEDKKYARVGLRQGFAAALQANVLNAPLFGTDEIKIFEIGRVFTKEGEQTALSIGYGGPRKKITTELTEVVKFLSDKLNTKLIGEIKEGVFECRIDSIFGKLPEPKTWDISIPSSRAEKFLQFSLYPFIVRDIALFVPSDTESDSVHKIILKEAGSLVVRSGLFDRFEKDGKISYAFRLVFQSNDKTLSDDEVNQIMSKIALIINAKSGWQVR